MALLTANWTNADRYANYIIDRIYGNYINDEFNDASLVYILAHVLKYFVENNQTMSQNVKNIMEKWKSSLIKDHFPEPLGMFHDGAFLEMMAVYLPAMAGTG